MEPNLGRRIGLNRSKRLSEKNDDKDFDHDWLENNPDYVKRLSKERIEKCLDKAESAMKNEPAFLEIEGKTIFVGDTHGDFTITKEVSKRFFEDKTQKIVFLGDYIDRAPEDAGTSVPNIAYLLFLKCAYPDNVILLKGNHEAASVIPCIPYEFKDEIESLYPGMHEKFLQVFNQMPLMVLVNNIFAAHGGILKGYKLEQLRTVNKTDAYAIETLTWSDPVISKIDRGAGTPFTGTDVKEFLKGIGAKVFIRGHDYNTLGTVIFGRTCLTIFSSRRYVSRGNKGILIAKTYKEISNIKDIVIEDFSTKEWKKYHVKILKK